MPAEPPFADGAGTGGSGTEAGSTGYSAYKADIWSMGVCLYCFLCGRTPFIAVLGGPTIDLLVQTEEVVLDATLLPTQRDLLAQLLIKAPSQRITMPSVKMHPWVTENGRTPLTQGAIVRQEVTDEDVRNSIGRVHNFRTLLRVYQAVRKLRRNSHSDGRASSSPTSSVSDGLNTAAGPEPSADRGPAAADAAAATEPQAAVPIPLVSIVPVLSPRAIATTPVIVATAPTPASGLADLVEAVPAIALLDAAATRPSHVM